MSKTFVTVSQNYNIKD